MFHIHRTISVLRCLTKNRQTFESYEVCRLDIDMLAKIRSASFCNDAERGSISRHIHREYRALSLLGNMICSLIDHPGRLEQLTRGLMTDKFRSPLGKSRSDLTLGLASI